MENNNDSFNISGNIIDVVQGDIFPGVITIKKGQIEKIEKTSKRNDNYILPGLIDSHIHIESSMLTPSEFARIAVTHGTVATVSDPHEIANVLGTEGVKFMIENGKKVPFKFFFGAPSCVPASSFETSGATISTKDVEELLSLKDVLYLSEVMDFRGVLSKLPDVIAKINAAKKLNKVIDGHAPGLRGNDAKEYFENGITTDHECYDLDEAKEKAALGIKILLREGSAARNFDNLLKLLKSFPEQVMLCTDDKHAGDLLQGHINKLISRAVKSGYDPINVIRAATLIPCKHYGLPVGLLQKGDPADFIVVDSPANMTILQTYINGVKVANNKQTLIKPVKVKPLNNFNVNKIKPSNIAVKAKGKHLNVIEVIEGEVITKKKTVVATIKNGKAKSDLEKDNLKIVVLNRYNNSPPAVGFVNNIGLQKGAIASTVAHDSHNIIAVGANDKSICKAINNLIDIRGGITLTDDNKMYNLPLPVAGLMSTEPGSAVAETYKLLDEKVKELGSKLKSPYMTLSFLALLVIPEIKISDKGLFDVNKLDFIPLFEE